MKLEHNALIKEVRACTLCAPYLPLGPRPVLQFNPNARILIAGQAPGKKVHETGVPFDDPSGKRLREWMGIDEKTFYNEKKIAILPMGFAIQGLVSLVIFRHDQSVPYFGARDYLKVFPILNWCL